jgi:hypothetical protein
MRTSRPFQAMGERESPSMMTPVPIWGTYRPNEARPARPFCSSLIRLPLALG